MVVGGGGVVKSLGAGCAQMGEGSPAQQRRQHDHQV